MGIRHIIRMTVSNGSWLFFRSIFILRFFSQVIFFCCQCECMNITKHIPAASVCIKECVERSFYVVFIFWHFVAHARNMDPKKAMRKERAAVRRDERDNFKHEMDMLMKDPTRTQLEFPASLQKSQRKQLHRYATRIGLKSRSTGTGE